MSFSDDFNRADSGTLGANWNGGCQISNNRATGLTGGAFNADWWTANTVAADQFSQCEMSGGANADNAAAGRVQDASNFYMHYNAGSGGTYIFKRVGGSFSSLASFGGTIVVNDLLKIVCNGTTLQAFVNGTQVGSDVTGQTDFATGQPGIVCFGNSTSSGVDNWQGGDLATGTTLTPGAGSISLSGQTLSALIGGPARIIFRNRDYV